MRKQNRAHGQASTLCLAIVPNGTLFISKHSELVPYLDQVVTAPKGVGLEAIAAYKLESMGLVTPQGNQVIPSCQLYRWYFREQLG